MDFIIKLSKSKDINTEIKYNSILIIIDKLIKYIYLIFYKKNFIVKQMTCVILNKVIRYYKISESITSDRNKIFKSNFQKTLIIEIGIKIKLLIIYYSQTDK